MFNKNSGEINQSSRLQNRAGGLGTTAESDFFSSMPEPVSKEVAPNYPQDRRHLYSPGIFRVYAKALD